MDFLPPIAPSLVFPRETYTPFSERCRDVLPGRGVIGAQVRAGVTGFVAIRIDLFVYFLT